jgi:hypothetical protein
MEFPTTVSSSGLFSKLTEDPDLLVILSSLRDVVAALAETTGRSIPHYTDHTIRHMDALWSVTDQVLTPTEINCLMPGRSIFAGLWLLLARHRNGLRSNRGGA